MGVTYEPEIKRVRKICLFKAGRRSVWLGVPFIL
jgi:hypothetical protein